MKQMPFLEAKNISKSFYGTKVLNDVSVNFFKGEIVGVIGENGAGKSTLMKILVGEYSRDEGEIFIEGQRVEIPTPADGRKLGIRMVYQDTRLISELPVYQNVFLATEMMCGRVLTNERSMRAKCEEMLRGFGIKVDVDALVKDLTIAQKQLVEIAKALVVQPNMLILDEPTSALTPAEVEQLFRIVREISGRGVTVVFISHRIPELLEICGRFVVLRDGVRVGTAEKDEVTSDSLIKMMVGRDVVSAAHPDEAKQRKETILSVRNLSSPGKFENINFDLYKNEILGLYGIDGNGQRELLQAIYGCCNYTGTISIDGRLIHPTSPSKANQEGISFLTNDRHGKNVFMSLKISENIKIPNLCHWSKFGVLDQKLSEEKVKQGLDTFNVKYNSDDQFLRELSGGNQQKVAISSRALQSPRVFIFDEPTIGIDVGSKSEIYTFLRKLTSEGIGVIILSSDMTEMMQVSDRILVMSNGRMSGEFCTEEVTEAQIGAAAIMGKKTEKTAAQEKKQPEKRRSKISGGKWTASLGVAMLIALLCAAGTAKSSTFLTPYSLGLILWQCIPLVLTSIGQNLIIIGGGIDLSLGSILSLTTCVMSYFLIEPGSGPVTMAVVLLSGIVCGLVNAELVVRLRIPHFIATLATQIVFYGVALTLRPSAEGRMLQSFTSAVKYKINGILPVAAIVLLIVVIAMEILLQRTKFGRALYAAGSNRDAAYSSGINVVKIRFMAYVLGALFAAAAGFVLGCRIGCGDPNAGSTFSIQSIASCVIGGTIMSGGRGTITGCALGALLMTVLSSFLNMIEISSYWQYVWQGGLILLSVIIHYITGRIEHRRV